MNGGAAAWVRARAVGAPANLLDRMIDALREDPAVSIPERLAEGALVLYAAVVSGSGGREDALTLLAADALFTHAFDAKAALDPFGVRDFASSWATGSRLGEILQSRTR